MKCLFFFVSLIYSTATFSGVARDAKKISEEIEQTKTSIQFHLNSNLDSAMFYINRLKSIHESSGSKKPNIEYLVYLGDYQRRGGKPLPIDII
jgi:arginine/lysine/ornithine decarboxylase